MVNKQIESWVKEEVGRDIHPYPEDVSEKELGDLADFTLAGYEDSDQIIYQPGKGEEENNQRFELFEKVAYLMYSSNHNPELFVHEAQRERVEESEILHENITKFIDPETTAQEMAMMAEENPEAKRIYVTNEYHVDGVDHIAGQLDDNDNLALGAGTIQNKNSEAFRLIRNEVLEPRYKGEGKLEKGLKNGIKHLKSAYDCLK